MPSRSRAAPAPSGAAPAVDVAPSPPGPGNQALQESLGDGSGTVIALVDAGLAEARASFEGQAMPSIDAFAGVLDAAALEADAAAATAEEAALTAFSTARIGALAAIDRERTAMDTALADAATGVDTWTAGAVGTAQASLDGAGAAAVAAGETKAGEAQTTADTRIGGARTEGNAAADEAVGIGERMAGVGGASAEIADGKARAAREIASDTATRIRTDLGGALDGLDGGVDELGDGFRERASEWATGLAAEAPEIVASFQTAGAGASEALRAAAPTASASLAEARVELEATLTAEEADASARIAAAGAEASAALAGGSEQARAGQAALLDATAGQGELLMGDLAAQLAGLAIPEAEASGVAAEIVGLLQADYAAAGAEVQARVSEGTTQTTTASGDLVRAFGDVSTTLPAALSTEVGELDGGLQTEGDAARSSLTEQVSAFTAAGDGGLGDLQTNLDQGVVELGGEFDVKLGELDGELTEQTAPAVEQAREPLTTLPDRISEAQQRVDSQAQEQEEGGFFSWVGRQFSSLWEMLTDPAFWAAVVVGLVLAVVVILLAPAELGLLAIIGIAAAIGAVCALVYTVVHNLLEGKTGWDVFDGWFENVLVGALFGAVGGLVLGLMGVTLAGVATLMGVTGLLTVITNLVTGRPWDENLLANILLAGLFAWAGKALGRFRPRAPIEEGPPRPVQDGPDQQPRPVEDGPDQQPRPVEDGPEEQPRPVEDGPEEQPLPETPEAPRTLEALREQMSEQGRLGFDQQREILPADRFRQMEGGFRNGDGTYDVARANRMFEGRAVTPEEHARRLAARDAQQAGRAREQIDRVNNLCDELDGTNRPNATLGDGSSEAALAWETENGKPWISREGHHVKVADGGRTLADAVTRLRGLRGQVTDPALLAEVDAAIARAEARIGSMQPALDGWGQRATLHPDVWNPDGSSKVQPGFPSQ